jgi:hypothetical protein
VAGLAGGKGPAWPGARLGDEAVRRAVPITAERTFGAALHDDQAPLPGARDNDQKGTP